MYSKIYLMLTGLFMGIADSMPGVSGSTIAYIMGTYDILIGAISGIMSLEKRTQSFPILVKIGSGWVVGFLCSVLIISTIIENNIYIVSSMFLGFTLISIPLTIKTEFKSWERFLPNIILTFCGIILVVFLMQIDTVAPQNLVMNGEQMTPLTYLYLIIAGMLAMGAMLLPGISGSSMLMILGIYYPIIMGIVATLHLNFQYLGVLIAVAIGILLGLICFAKLFTRLFKNHRLASFYFIEGLLIGSLWPIILSPTTISATSPALNWTNFSWIGFLIGIICLLGLELFRHQKSRVIE